jgi:hypothetical protein
MQLLPRYLFIYNFFVSFEYLIFKNRNLKNLRIRDNF